MADESPDNRIKIRVPVKEILESLRPDPNTLVILTVGIIVVYGIYMLQKDALRLADTALGGLLGYLGSYVKNRQGG